MHILSATVTIPEFVPYQNNGGTVAAVTTQDGSVVFANDTRLSGPEGIISRCQSKHWKLTNKCYMLASGMLADADELNRKLQQEIIAYQFFHKSEPTLDSISQIMSLLLYGKREFPYYVFTILAGIDRNNEPQVYSYDAIGCASKSNFAALGSGGNILEPALYRIVQEQLPLTAERAKNILNKLFHSTAERDVCTGDMVEFCAINREGQFFMVTNELRTD